MYELLDEIESVVEKLAPKVDELIDQWPLDEDASRVLRLRLALSEFLRG